MGTFEAAFTTLLGHEGGYSDDPADPGGRTMYGITERVARAAGYTGVMRNLPLETAQAIAKAQYWDKYGCDNFDPRVAFQILDAAYNGGPVVHWMQVAAGAVNDGVLGPDTIAAVKATDPRGFALKFLSYRMQYLTDLMAWGHFGKGWARRIASNMLLAAS